LLEQGGAKHSPCADKVKLACGGTILAFSSLAHYQTTYDCLQAAYADHYSAMMAQYVGLSEEDLNDLLDQIAFDEDAPLLDFEQQIGFNSYRTYFRALEDAWLLNGMDPATDPDNTCLFNDPVEQTLMGANGAVMVAGVIYYYAPNGQMFVISNGDCGLLDQLINDPSSVSDPNVTEKRFSSACDDCYWALSDRNNYAYDGNKKKIKWKHDHTWNLIWNQNEFRGVQKSYRKKFGFWKRYRRDMSIEISGGMILTATCDQPNSYSGQRADHGWRMTLSVWGGSVMDYQCFMDCQAHADFIAHQTVNTSLCN
jgi:hypothetical protein